MVRRLLKFALTVLLAGSALAASSEPQPGDVPVSAAEWRRLTEGRVVWYSLNGEHWGREYFHPNRQRATFVYRDGTCVSAPWIESDGVFCFAYGGLHCFNHVRRDGQLVVLPVDGGPMQTIERITDDGPLSCEPPLMS